MSRTDTSRLKCPEPVVIVTPEAKSVSQANKAEEAEAVATDKHEQLEALLEQMQLCPHCSARLSAIDVKMNRCMACFKPLIAAETLGQQGTTIRIGI